MINILYNTKYSDTRDAYYINEKYHTQLNPGHWKDTHKFVWLMLHPFPLVILEACNQNTLQYKIS